jgi:hypothetical protein
MVDHVGMLNYWRASNGKGVYGDQWGDIANVPPLAYTRRRFLDPFVNPTHTALEIGPGGGRWTQLLLGFQHLYVVDRYQELLDELARTVDGAEAVRNNGSDFPGVPDRSVHFVFSFGTFVHLDADTIAAYLANLHRILMPAANVVLHYSDKRKVMARENPGFADMTPDRMRTLLAAHRYRIVDEDDTSLWHSSVVRFVDDEAHIP